MQFLDHLKPLGLLVLRVSLGASFIYHGVPKLTDPGNALRTFAGYNFPGYFAYLFGILEVFGGGLLIAGLFTRGAALLLTIEMGMVLYKTVIPSEAIKGFERYEMPLFLAAMAFALATTGAGAISIDAFTFESSRKSSGKSKTKD